MWQLVQAQHYRATRSPNSSIPKERQRLAPKGRQPLEYFAREAAEDVRRGGFGRENPNGFAGGRCVGERRRIADLAMEHRVAMFGPQPVRDLTHMLALRVEPVQQNSDDVAAGRHPYADPLD